jgi:hypothetical protein
MILLCIGRNKKSEVSREQKISNAVKLPQLSFCNSNEVPPYTVGKLMKFPETFL